MSVDPMIPSVEDATLRYASACRDLMAVTDIDDCDDCLYISGHTEAVSVALDMANAHASDERIRASVAW